MWYSRIKTAISKQSAEDIIQSELRSGTYVDPATEDADVIKSKLIEKYGSEEAMLEAINNAIVQASHKLTGSSMADPSNETGAYFQNQGGIDAFYVLPDGTQTPNLRSHVMFDKFLVHKLGIDPSALTDRSDRHILSELTGAMRVNVSGGKVNVTIYTPPTPEQQKWLKNNDISREELDIRRDSMEKPQVNTNEITGQLSEQGKQLSDISFQLDQMINEVVVTRVNPKFSPSTVGTEPYYITENPQGLNEELFEKLKDIKNQISYVKDLANDARLERVTAPVAESTELTAGADDAQVVPFDVNTLPLVLGATTCNALVPLPSSTLFAVNVVAPVPPLATGTVSSTATVPRPKDVRAADAVVAPVPPLETNKAGPDVNRLSNVSKLVLIFVPH